MSSTFERSPRWAGALDRFAVDFDQGGVWREWCYRAAIGAQRLIRGEQCTTRRVQLRIAASPVCRAISE